MDTREKAQNLLQGTYEKKQIEAVAVLIRELAHAENVVKERKAQLERVEKADKYSIEAQKEAEDIISNFGGVMFSLNRQRML